MPGVVSLAIEGCNGELHGLRLITATQTSCIEHIEKAENTHHDSTKTKYQPHGILEQ